MRRRFCWVFSACAGITAVIAVLILVVSCFRHDTLSFASGQTTISVQSLRGKVAVSWRSAPGASDTDGWRWETADVGTYTLEDEFDHARLGFSVERRQHHYRDGRAIVARKVLFRLDALAVVFVGIALAPWLIRRLRHARDRCRNCGYILKGSTRRCPECGNAVARGGRLRADD